MGPEQIDLSFALGPSSSPLRHAGTRPLLRPEKGSQQRDPRGPQGWAVAVAVVHPHAFELLSSPDGQKFDERRAEQVVRLSPNVGCLARHDQKTWYSGRAIGADRR